MFRGPYSYVRGKSDKLLVGYHGRQLIRLYSNQAQILSQEASPHATGVAALHLAGSRGTGEMAIFMLRRVMLARYMLRCRYDKRYLGHVVRVWGKKIAAMDTDKKQERDDSITYDGDPG